MAVLYITHNFFKESLRPTFLEISQKKFGAYFYKEYRFIEI